MAYTTPPYFQHQDTISKAQLDLFEANIQELIAICHIPLMAHSQEATGTDNWYAFEHRHRWLFYVSESEERPGEMGPWDPTIDDIVSLEYTTEGLWVDMDTFDWMVYGRVYTVEHVVYAWEVTFELE